MVVRLDIKNAFLPPLNEVLEENMAFAAMRAFKRAYDELGVPLDDLDGKVPIALRAAVRAVYFEVAVAGGAKKVPGQVAKKKR